MDFEQAKKVLQLTEISDKEVRLYRHIGEGDPAERHPFPRHPVA